MGWRFRRSVKILPGVRLNFSNSGVSTTLGGSPLSVNIGKRGIKRTVSIPGTGLYHTAEVGVGSQSANNSNSAGCLTLVGAGSILLLLGLCSSSSTKTPLTEAPTAPGAPITLAHVPMAVPMYAQAKANCRQAPSLKAKVVTKLRKGARVTMVGADPEFYRVEGASGLSCYVAKFLLSETKSGIQSEDCKTRHDIISASE
jgi:hypothetical protein